MAMLKALIVRDPWASFILDGSKRWELRGRPTRIRGQIGIIKARTGHVWGTCDVVDCLGPLSPSIMTTSDALTSIEKREVQDLGIPYEKTFAWVLANSKRFQRPMRYSHPSGAVTWVNIDLGSIPNSEFDRIDLFPEKDWRDALTFDPDLANVSQQ